MNLIRGSSLQSLDNKAGFCKKDCIYYIAFKCKYLCDGEKNTDKKKADFFWVLFEYFFQHCFICRPSDYTVSEDAGIEPRTVATSAMAVRQR